MIVGGGGDGTAAWNGTITVHPGELDASSSDFYSAGDEILTVMASTMAFADPAGLGITDPGAAAAWTRLTTVWSKDLGDLSNGLADLGQKLSAGGASYATTDGSVMTVRSTSVTGG